MGGWRGYDVEQVQRGDIQHRADVGELARDQITRRRIHEPRRIEAAHRHELDLGQA
jgi:hypothetical protein